MMACEILHHRQKRVTDYPENLKIATWRAEKGKSARAKKTRMFFSKTQIQKKKPLTQGNLRKKKCVCSENHPDGFITTSCSVYFPIPLTKKATKGNLIKALLLIERHTREEEEEEEK
jgi:hypothetical protein